MPNTEVIASWYDENAEAEHNRLVDGRLEYAVTMRIILDSISRAGKDRQLKIADIGGGTGRYAVELAKLGHRVTLIDISQSELNLAAQHAKEHNVTLESIICADASSLRATLPSFQTGNFDAILLLGPLYHLLEESERLQTIETCASMLKPDGLLFASFVTKTAHLRDLAVRDPGRLHWEAEFYKGYLESGKYTRKEVSFSYHVHPREIRGMFESVKSAEVKIERIVACEGFLGGGLSKNLNTLKEVEWEAWVSLILEWAEEETVLAGADHILAVARHR